VATAGGGGSELGGMRIRAGACPALAVEADIVLQAQARAKTGVAVLYRRWPNKDDLVLAAIRHYGTTHPVDVPDTGRLRDDMIALLSSFSSTRVSFAAIVSAAFSGLLASSGLTPARVREKILADRPRQSDQVSARAQERGEITLDRTPTAVLAMPFDLMRHDMLMTYQPIPPERVLAIVDDLFMPLVAISRPPGGRPPSSSSQTRRALT